MTRVPRGGDSPEPRHGPIRGRRQYEGLNRRERRALDGAREVIRYSRDNRVGIYRAIRELRTKGVRTSIGSVKDFYGNAVETDWRGMLRAKDRDPNLRVMKPLTTGGHREVFVRGSKQAGIVAQHEDAVRALLAGDDSKMRAWKDTHRDRVFTGTDGQQHALETDSDVIEERDARGEISYEDLYPEVS